MDTNRLKRFATEARNKLMQGVAHRLMALGFRPDGSAPEEPQLQGGGATFMGGIVSEDFYQKWNSLHQAVQMRSIDEIVEEAAYTWFNRLVAIQIMVRNHLISPVLDFDEAGARVPVIVAEARQGRCPQMDSDTSRQLNALIDDDRKTDEQFSLLITAFCHSNPVIYSCFGHIKDYTELLLPIDILADGGFVSMLNDTDFITDEDYESPELIGWLYQFYISEKKDDVFASFKKGKKAEAKDIPAATQIFTPNWIVKYMVQNTVGRIYLDNNPDAAADFKPKWNYLIENEDTSPEHKLVVDDLADLKVADLACGSGHILNECFDLLYDLYVAEGYSRRQAIESIFANNLTGIDIDTRAKQLATFALLLKACQKDESFADAHAMPRVMDFPHVDRYTWRDTGGHMACALEIEWVKGANQEIDDCFTLMEQAHNLGSIMKFDISPATRDYIKQCVAEQKRQQKYVDAFDDLFRGFEIILALTEKYSALVMNPPYMGGSNMNTILSDYVRRNYPNGKADLMTVFMIQAMFLIAPNGIWAMINIPSWMFLSSFEALRRIIITNQQILGLLHNGRGVFGSDFGSVTFVMQNINPYKSGCYRRLFKEHVQVRSIERIHQLYLDKNYGYYQSNQQYFKKIPSLPIAYWVSEKAINCFQAPNLTTLLEFRSGMSTTDNNRFLRYWHEIDFNNLGLGVSSIEKTETMETKWYPYNKGGSFRRWFGNRSLVINWLHNGSEIKHWVVNNPKDPKTTSWSRRLFNIDKSFKESISWSALSSGNISLRYCEEGFMFDSKGASAFGDTRELKFVLGVLNSNVSKLFLSLLCPTVDFGPGSVSMIPLPSNKIEYNLFLPIIENNITISREDWDAHETSWDFKQNEMLSIVQEMGQQDIRITEVFSAYINKWFDLFMQLHSNEEVLNRQFIEIYGLQDELTPDVPLDEVTILQQGEISIEDYHGDVLEKEPVRGHHVRFISKDNKTHRLAICPQIVWHADVIMKQFISYAVGCMMGRYSIDKPGLILANQGDGLKEYEAQVPNSRFEVDDDGIIPLMPSDTWFNDNATLRFKRFVATVFGEEMLNENLNFIEQSLGKSIDHYFVKDFWKDHKKMYQNRPIYWLFSSKKGAFQCLVYMHRMNAYTAERIRSKYLLPHIEWLVQKTQELEDMPLLNTQDRRTLDNLHSQIAECREYHDRLHVIADRQIDFDLDDGVVVNYAKFGDTLAKLK